MQFLSNFLITILGAKNKGAVEEFPGLNSALLDRKETWWELVIVRIKNISLLGPMAGMQVH